MPRRDVLTLNLSRLAASCKRTVGEKRGKLELILARSRAYREDASKRNVSDLRSNEIALSRCDILRPLHSSAVMIAARRVQEAPRQVSRRRVIPSRCTDTNPPRRDIPVNCGIAHRAYIISFLRRPYRAATRPVGRTHGGTLSWLRRGYQLAAGMRYQGARP